MFSVIIIGQIEKSEFLNKLSNCSQIGEILLFNNKRNDIQNISAKIKCLNLDVLPNCLGGGEFSNAIINTGIKECKYDYIGIINSNILFPENSFEQIFNFLLNNDVGLIGLDSLKSVDNTEFSYPDDCEIKFCPVDFIDENWGYAIFGAKSNFYQIPQDIKISCADKYLFYKNSNKINYKIYDSNIIRIKSAVNNSAQYNKIKKNDIKLFNKLNLYQEKKYSKEKKKYDLYVSIGAACSCSRGLRDNFLQYYSYPFDWLYGSNFLDRTKIIANDFENWIDYENLEYIGKRENLLPRDIYKNKLNDIVFTNDFPINTPLKDSYTEVKNKYTRRIKRFLNHINNSSSVLFVYLQCPNDRADVTCRDLIEGYEILKNKFPNVDVNILYLFSERERKFKDRKVIRISNNITRINFDYDAYIKEYPYVVKEKTLNKLLSKYRITFKHLLFKNIIQKVFRIKYTQKH